MATLIPSLGSCQPRMTSGERRLAERLERQLHEDYLLWYDVPIGPKQTHADFVVLHPRRDLLILEIKDWGLDTIQNASPQRPGAAGRDVDNGCSAQLPQPAPTHRHKNT